MTEVDQFESVFRAAVKERYSHAPIAVRRVLLLTDLPADQAQALRDRVQAFLSVLGDTPEWSEATVAEAGDSDGLLALIEGRAPDLVCTYRNVGSDGWRWPYSLGEHVHLLTQATSTPVLLLPHPSEAAARGREDTDVVMALTDHLAGDHSLVRHAAHFTHPGGRLLLAHVEDDHTFERYMDAIGKIPAIDTEMARETLRERLSKDPADYADSVVSALAEAGVDVRAEAIVTAGHRLRTFRGLIEEHAVDLLVCNTKDEDQLAMHGMAYALAVELRALPLLLL